MCNPSANSLLDIFSFLKPLPEANLSRVAKIFDCASKADFCQKIYRPLKQVHVDVNHNLDF